MVNDRILLSKSETIIYRQFKRNINPDISRGYGYLKSNNEYIFFHISKIPRQIRRAIDVKIIKTLDKLPSSIPQLSFEIEITEDGKSNATEIAVHLVSKNALLFYDGESFISPNNTYEFKLFNHDNKIIKPKTFYIVAYSLAISQEGIEKYYFIMDLKSFELNSNVFDNISEGITNQIYSTQLFRLLNTYLSDLNNFDKLSRLLNLNEFIKILFWDQIKLLDSSPDIKLVRFIISIDKHFASEYFFNTIIKSIDKGNYLFIDIESDGNSINQIAFIANNTSYNYRNLDDSTLNEVIKILNDKYYNYLFIGHNIRNWDLPLLCKYGLNTINNEKIWDTILVEALLDPLRQSLALNSAHDAEEDVLLAKNLFVLQIKSIILNGNNSFDYLAENDAYISLIIKNKSVIEELKTNNSFSISDLNLNDYNSLFRRNKTQAFNYSEYPKTFNLNPDVKNIIVIPSIMFDYFKFLPNSRIISKYYTDYSSADISKFKSFDDSFHHNYFQNLVKRVDFINIGLSYSIIPLFIKINYNISLDKFIDNNILQNYYKLEDIFENNIKVIITDIFTFNEFHIIDHNGPNTCCLFLNPEIIKEDKVKIIELTGEEIFPNLNNTEARVFINANNSLTKIACEVIPEKIFSKLSAKYDFYYLQKVANRYLFWGKNNINKYLDKIRLYNLDSTMSFMNVEVNIPKLRIGKYRENDVDTVILDSFTKYKAHYWAYKTLLVETIISELYLREHFIPVLIIENEEELEYIQKIFAMLKYTVLKNIYEINNIKYHGKQIPIYVSAYNKLIDIIKAANGKILFIFETILKFDNSFYNQIGGEKISQADLDDDNITNDIQDVLIEDVYDYEEQSNFVESDQLNDRIKSASLISLLIKIIANSDIKYKIYLLDHLDFISNESSNLHVKYIEYDIWPEIDVFNVRKNIISDVMKNDEVKRNYSFEEIKDDIESIFLKGKGGNGTKGALTEIQCRYLKSIIESENDSILVSLPTGGGKSVLFQGPAILNGELSGKFSLVISPLKALMVDQVQNLINLGYYSSVDAPTGDLSRLEINDIYRRFTNGSIKLLYTSPERFRSKSFLKALEFRLINDKGPEYWIFDEAHCISQWGLDFRPDYLYAAKFIASKINEGYKAKILFMSATVTNQVYDDLGRIFND